MPFRRFRSAFTLIELLVVIAIIAILAVVVVLTLNPAELLRQSRDSNRISDVSTLNSALNLYSTDQSGASTFNLGSSSVVYVSLPDPAATSTVGSNCASLGLPPLWGSYVYHCAASSTLRNANGQGWIPVNFQNISSGNPLGSLPVDPTNQSSSRLYYTYATNGTQFEITSNIESAKYGLGGSNDIISGDGSSLATVYAKGSNLTLEPLDYGDASLMGYWPLNEGANSTAYDSSGNNVNGTWLGPQVGTSGYYSPGKVQSWAGTFDGSTTYVSVSLPISQPTFSISAWVNLSATSSAWKAILSVNGGYGFFIDPASKADFFYSTGHPGTSALAPSTWYFVTMTLSGGIVNIYVNGVNQSTASVSPGSPTFVRIGDDLSNEAFPGMINNIRVYNRVLTAAQVAALYNGSK